MNELFLQWLIQQAQQQPVPSLQQIGNLGVPQPTPPFIPGQVGGNNDDLLAQINSILSAPPSPVPSYTPDFGGGLGGFAKGALSQLPQGLAILASAFNPQAGEMLQGQINRQQAIKLQGIQAERERIQKRDDLRTAIGVDLVRDQLKERTTIREEKRRLEQQKEIFAEQNKYVVQNKKDDREYARKQIEWEDDHRRATLPDRVMEAEKLARAANLPQRDITAVKMAQEFAMDAPSDVEYSVLSDIASKLVNQLPLYSGEKEILDKINEKRSKETTEERQSKLDAEAALTAERKAAAAMGGRGQRQSLEEFTQRQIVDDVVKKLFDNVSDKYAKTRSGDVKPVDKLNKIEEFPGNHTLLSDEENAAEREKNLKRAMEERRKLMQSLGTKAEPSVNPGMLADDPVVLKMAEDINNNRVTPQQLMDQLGSSNLNPEKKAKALEFLKGLGAVEKPIQQTGKPVTTVSPSKGRIELDKALGIGVAEKKTTIPLTNTTAASAMFGNTGAKARTDVANMLEQLRKSIPNATYEDLLKYKR